MIREGESERDREPAASSSGWPDSSCKSKVDGLDGSVRLAGAADRDTEA